MKKKLAALLLATVMCTSALAGCGNSESGSSKSTGSNSVVQTTGSEETKDAATEEATSKEITFPLEETIEFTAFAGMNGEVGLDETLSVKTAMERANINIVFNNVLSSDMTEKQNLLLNSGDYPDFFIKSNIDSEKYGMQGVLIPLEDLIREYAPNLTAALDAREGWDYITAADGHIYALPELGAIKPVNPTLWINKKWMDNLGLKEPTSYEELYEVLKAFKEQDANGNGDPDDEIPMHCDVVVPPFMLLGYEDYTYDPNTNLAVIDGELTYVPTHESYKELLAYINKLFIEGLLDKNTFTQGHEQASAVGQSGDVLGCFFEAASYLVVGRDNDDDYIALTPFHDTLPLSNAVSPNTLAITDKCENPEVLIAWADYFYSEEGAMLAWMGVEGETYQWNNDGTWEWILGKGYGDDISTIRSGQTMQGAFNHPSLRPAAWLDMSPEIDPDEVYLQKERGKAAEHGAYALPAMSYTEEEKEELAYVSADISSYVGTYRAQVAVGEINLEETWDDYVKTLKQMGLDSMMEIYNRAYQDALSE